MSDHRPSEKLVASYQQFKVYVNQLRFGSKRTELSDIEMVTAYSICHEFWNYKKQAALRAKLWKLL